MIKLIASDVDGTILQNGATKPSEEQMALIRECMEKGIHFVAASGRQYPNLYRLFRPLCDRMSFAAENGSLVMQNNQQVFTSEIPRQIACDLIADIAQDPQCEVMLCTPLCTYFSTTNPTFYEHMLFGLKNTVAFVDNLLEVDGPWLKISAFVHNNAAAEKVGHYQDRWGGQLQVALAEPEWVDFGCASKGSALAFLQKQMGIQKEEMIAFGDNFNDVKMFAAVGTSYSMKGASPEVQKYSTHTVETVEEVLREIVKSV